MLTKIYYSPESYDTNMRDMQQTFKAIFGSDIFQKLLVDEMSAAMTELVNKMFVTI